MLKVMLKGSKMCYMANQKQTFTVARNRQGISSFSSKGKGVSLGS